MIKIPKTWNKLQEREIQNYINNSASGIFSCDGLKGAEITGEKLNEFIGGKHCLDIGCGALRLPFYMKIADRVKFTGIDPYDGYERDFDFIAGIAENIPFENNIFDAVLFATSLDHVINPRIAIHEAGRVLKNEGYLFIWTGIKDGNDEKYINWQKKKKPCNYDEMHLWAFTHNSLLKLTNKFTFIERILIHKNKCPENRESLYIFKK